MGWDEAVDDFANELDSLSQDVSEADGMREESDTESSSHEGLKANWWAQRLANVAKVKRPQRPLKVVSGCAGCCAEAHVLTVF